MTGARFAITHADHVKLAMPPGGEERAEAFYTGLLGFERVLKPAPLAVRGGCWFEKGAVHLHLGVESDFRPARKAHPALIVQGFDTLCAELEAAGVPLRPDDELPGVRRCSIEDPFGNRIELVEARVAGTAVPPVRAATRADAKELFELLRELGYTELDAGAFAGTLEQALCHPEIRILVVEDASGRVDGMLSLSHRPQLRLGGALVTIDELVVAQRARGRGIGRALLDCAKAIAVELGARRVELLTNRRRESYSRGFYPNSGFVEVDSAVMRLA